MSFRGRYLLPTAALLVAAASWGSTVVVAKGAYESTSPTTLLISRLLLTGLSLVVVFPPLTRISRSTLFQGLTLGLLYNGGIVTQMIGLEHIPPSLSGFVTAGYVVFTAVLSSVLMRQRQGGRTWLAIGLTVVGIGALALGGQQGGTDLLVGGSLTLMSALLFACHIVFLGRWVRRNNVKHLIMLQAVVGALGALGALGFVDYQIPQGAADWAQVAYLGVFCGAVAMFLQGWAQNYVPPTPSAVIMCSEPVWAAALAIAFGFEALTWNVVIGGTLVVSALLLIAWPRSNQHSLDDLMSDLSDKGSRVDR